MKRQWPRSHSRALHPTVSPLRGLSADKRSRYAAEGSTARMKSRTLARRSIAAVLLFASTSCASADDAMYVLESFQAFCWEPDAEFAQIEKMARAAKLKTVPPEISNAMAGPDSKRTQAYFLSKEGDGYTILGISEPDVCVISYSGADSKRVKEFLTAYFKPNLVHKDEVGLQTTETYVLGGSSGSITEAARDGLIMFTYAKEATEVRAGTVSWMPPRTARLIFR